MMSNLLTTNEFMKVVVMALTEKIILVILHLVIMYTVKLIYHESTEEYFVTKREEIVLY